MASAATIEARERLAAKQKEVAEIFSKYPNLDMSEDVLKDIQAKNAEMNDLGKAWETKRDLDAINERAQAGMKTMNHPVTEPSKGGTTKPEPAEQKSVGELFTLSAEYQSKSPGRPRVRAELSEVSLKATMTVATGFAPENRRQTTLVYTAQRRPVVADLIPQDDVTVGAIRFMEETTFTNAAAPVAEGAAKPEGALGFTERTVPVEVIAVLLPVTEQQIEDVVGIRAIIDNRLTLMLLLTEENQLLNGNGASPQLQGFYNKAGIQTQAKGGDPTPDAIYKAITKVRFTGFAEPSGVVLHPNDWQDIRLLRTADGLYIWGSPAEAGPERIWGLPVVPTTAATENLGLVGDFRLYAHISRRQGITIEVSDSHSDFFAKNLLAIRAEERLSLEIYRAASFCTVSGI